MSGHIVPPDGYDGARDLGTEEKRWRHARISGNITDGTNTVTVAQALAAYTESSLSATHRAAAAPHSGHVNAAGDTITGDMLFADGVKIQSKAAGHYMICTGTKWEWYINDIKVGEMP